MGRDRIRMMKVESEHGPGTFGGLYVSPGPLQYNNGGYVVLQDPLFIERSPVYKSGITEDSIYFDPVTTGYGTNMYNWSFMGTSIDGVTRVWRFPTIDEVFMILYGIQSSTFVNSQGYILGGNRNGSTYNGVSGAKYCSCTVSADTSFGYFRFYNTSYTIRTWIIFPDDRKIHGPSLSINNTSNSGGTITYNDWLKLKEQGCAAIPMAGYLYDYGYSVYFQGFNGGSWFISNTVGPYKCVLDGNLGCARILSSLNSNYASYEASYATTNRSPHLYSTIFLVSNS